MHGGSRGVDTAGSRVDGFMDLGGQGIPGASKPASYSIEQEYENLGGPAPREDVPSTAYAQMGDDGQVYKPMPAPDIITLKYGIIMFSTELSLKGGVKFNEIHYKNVTFTIGSPKSERV